MLVTIALLASCKRGAPPAGPEADAAAAAVVPPPRADGRLPREVHPTRYALDLVVDPATAAASRAACASVVIADEPTQRDRAERARADREAARAAPTAGRLPATTALRRPPVPKDPEELVLAFDRDDPARKAEIDIDYDGPFGPAARPLPRTGARTPGTRSRSSSRPTRGARSRASTSPGSRRRSTVTITVARAIGRVREHARASPRARRTARGALRVRAVAAAADLPGRAGGRAVRRARRDRRGHAADASSSPPRARRDLGVGRAGDGARRSWSS